MFTCVCVCVYTKVYYHNNAWKAWAKVSHVKVVVIESVHMPVHVLAMHGKKLKDAQTHVSEVDGGAVHVLHAQGSH